MKTIEISDEALKLATPEQLDRVAVLLAGPSAEKITVTASGFGLPDNYVAFTVVYSGGTQLHGGIDADGRAST